MIAAGPEVEALVAGLVDYAGLFPPASLDMRTAVHLYDMYRSGPDAWMLGRFIVPAARLSELVSATSTLLPRPAAANPWRLAVLIGADVAADMECLAALRQGIRDGSEPVITIEAVEGRAATVADVEAARSRVPPDTELYLEMPLAPTPTAVMAAVRRCSAHAKIRTGGVTAEAIPSTREVATFMVAAARAGVAFKATAGLHHAIRGCYPLTYAADSPRAVMHGFINVFVGAALANAGSDEDDVVAVLEEAERSAFQFNSTGVRWRDRECTLAQLRTTRAQFAHSFGSCSFREPVEDLHAWPLL